MSAWPSGTVTVLMSDVVASSKRWAEDVAQPWRDLDALHQTIGSSVDAQGGVLVKARGEGDSHFAAFARPSAALRAAAAIQREIGEEGVPIRVAVSMGELEARDGDYVGLLVNRTARIRNAVHAGQIVCTRPVADVAMPVEGLSVRSLGSHRIKDIPDAIELLQLCGHGLPASFPPLRTLDTATTAMMAVAFVDEVASVRRATATELPAWQGPLYRFLRCTAQRHDGRFLKLLGDGCVVAFEDPRSAVAFAREVCAQPDFHLRAGVSAGLVDMVEGELTGVPFFDAATASKRAAAGEVELSPVMHALVGARHDVVPDVARATTGRG